MAQGGSLLLFLVLSHAGIVFGEPYLRQLSGSTDNESNETELTTTLTATTTATTVGTTLTEAIVERTADNSALIIVLIILAVVIVLGLCSAGAYGIIAWQQSSARNNIKLVKQVDTEAADFEANLTSLQQHVQRLNLRLEKEKEKKEMVSKEYTAFQTKWKNVEVQSREFLDLQYTPCFRDRQEWQRGKDQLRRQKQQQRQAEVKRKAAEQLQKDIRKKRAELEKEEQKKQKQRLALAKQQPKAAPAGGASATAAAAGTAGGAGATAGAPAGGAGATAGAVPVIDPPKTPEELDALAAELVKAHQEDSGRAVLVIGATSGNLVPEEEVGFCPETAVTSNKELTLQLRSLETLRNNHSAIVTELKAIRDQAGITGLEEPALRVSVEAKSQGWWEGNYLEEQVKILNSFSHPLIKMFKVKPHGVLGTMEGDKDLMPLSPIEAVVVDPAGFPFIGYRNSCRGAGGASGSIYKWLNLAAPPASGRFPPEVNRHFVASREVEAEGRAKLHAYNAGQVVIHTVGPKLRDLLKGVQGLSQTYLNVLSEYCQALLTEANVAKDANVSKGAQKGGAKGKGKGKEPVPIPKVLRLCPISSGIFCEDARLQPHMAEITFASISLALAMLPLELQDLLKTVQLEVCVFQKREVSMYQGVLDAKVSSAADLLKLEARGQIASRGGGFDWVRKQNGSQDRLERLAAFMNTAQALASSGYVLGGGKAQHLELQPMLQGTRIHRAADEGPTRDAKDPNAAAPEVPPITPNVVYDQDGLTVLDAAVKVSKEGKKAVAVNAASAYSVGGGVMSGGRHALEESCCITSTLLASLQKAQWDQLQTEEGAAAAHGSEGYHAHVPVDGCIVSPFVEVFREGSNDGYGFLPSPVKLQGVCSVAMFNMNPRVSDSPLDAPRDFKTYCRQAKMKFRSVVMSAVELGAEVLVCPDVGCGVFGNDPEVLGTMLGQVLREPEARVQVLLTGQVAFAEAVKRAASGVEVELTPPAYFSQVYGKSSSGSGRSQKAWRSKDERPVVATLVTPADSGGVGGTAGANPVVVAGAGAVASDVAGTPAAATHVAGTPAPATHVAGTPAPATHVASTAAAEPVTGTTDF